MWVWSIGGCWEMYVKLKEVGVISDGFESFFILVCVGCLFVLF